MSKNLNSSPLLLLRRRAINFGDLRPNDATIPVSFIEDATNHTINDKALSLNKEATFQSVYDFIERAKGYIAAALPFIPLYEVGNEFYNQGINIREQEILRLSEKYIPDLQKNYNSLVKRALYDRNITIDEKEFLDNMFKTVIKPFIQPRYSELYDQNSLNQVQEFEKKLKDLVKNVDEVYKYNKKSAEIKQLHTEIHNMLKIIIQIKKNIRANPDYEFDISNYEDELDNIEKLLLRERGLRDDVDEDSGELYESNYITQRFRRFNEEYQKVYDEIEKNPLLMTDDVLSYFIDEISNLKESIIEFSVDRAVVSFEDIRRANDTLDLMDRLLQNVKDIIQPRSRSRLVSFNPSPPSNSDNSDNSNNRDESKYITQRLRRFNKEYQKIYDEIDKNKSLKTDDVLSHFINEIITLKESINEFSVDRAVVSIEDIRRANETLDIMDRLLQNIEDIIRPRPRSRSRSRLVSFIPSPEEPSNNDNSDEDSDNSDEDSDEDSDEGSNSDEDSNEDGDEGSYQSNNNAIINIDIGEAGETKLRKSFRDIITDVEAEKLTIREGLNNIKQIFDKLYSDEKQVYRDIYEDAISKINNAEGKNLRRLKGFYNSTFEEIIRDVQNGRLSITQAEREMKNIYKHIPVGDKQIYKSVYENWLSQLESLQGQGAKKQVKSGSGRKYLTVKF